MTTLHFNDGMHSIVRPICNNDDGMVIGDAGTILVPLTKCVRDDEEGVESSPHYKP